MTRIEKETVISALSVYAEQQRRKADRERKRGELGKAAQSQREHSKAQAVMIIFCQILTEPCGTVLI